MGYVGYHGICWISWDDRYHGLWWISCDKMKLWDIVDAMGYRRYHGILMDIMEYNEMGKGKEGRCVSVNHKPQEFYLLERVSYL